MPAMALPGRLGRSAMSVPSNVGSCTAEVTWSRCDVDANDHANVTPGLIST
jgi:hypothetical protein